MLIYEETTWNNLFFAWISERETFFMLTIEFVEADMISSLFEIKELDKFILVLMMFKAGSS